MRDTVAVEISRESYERARRYIEETRAFKSVDELVEHMLWSFLPWEPREELTPEEEKKIRERLRELGHLP